MSLATRGASSGANGSGAPRAARLAPIAAFAALLGGLVLLFLGTSTPPPADAAVTCPNETFRVGSSRNLPDCRAYELVTPLGAMPHYDAFEGAKGQASASGDRLAFFSYTIPPDVESFGNVFLSTRGAEGWSTEGVIPPQSTMNAVLCVPAIVAWSPDFSKGLLTNGYDAFQQGCGQDDPPLVEGRPDGFQNLFVRDASAGDPTYQLVNPTPEGVEPADALPQAVSSDLSYVAFNSLAPLTAEATRAERVPGQPYPDANLYVWRQGTLRLATVLPDGTATHGLIANGIRAQGGAMGGATYSNAFAADGSRVYFQAGGNLYVRENPAREPSPLDGSGGCTDPSLACTTQVDAPQGGSGAGGGGDFMWASTDGSAGYFTAPASAGLTADTAAGSGQNLYRYSSDSGTLENLTAAADARVLGVSGLSDDGSVVYFVAEGDLAPGATAGEPNLYRGIGGAVSLVATLSHDTAVLGVDETDRCNWRVDCARALVSPDGRYLAFHSIASPTGYDSVPEDPAACDTQFPRQPSGAPCSQIFLYDAVEEQLDCVSCNPSGAPPTGHTRINPRSQIPQLNQVLPGFRRRNLSEGGKVFFESSQALVPRDSNGKRDVYQYVDGQLSLISTGSSPDDSYFADASASGDSVFFATEQALVAGDTDEAASLYDARVGGGFAEPPAPAPACEGESCRGAGAAAPAGAAAGTAAFQGSGNQLRGQRRSCNSIARRAQRLSQAAKRLRRRAQRVAGAGKGRQLRRRAARLDRKAEGLSKRAKRCRQADRRAGK